MASEIKKLKKGLWVRIHWDDILSDDDQGWVEEHKLEARVWPCITVGKVVKKTKKEVVLAMSAGANDNQVGTATAIPLGCITKVDVWQ